MYKVRLFELAISNRGKGWLGAMELMDFLTENAGLDGSLVPAKQRFENKFGQLILGGELGCDESAVQAACNACIDSLLQSLQAAKMDN